MHRGSASLIVLAGVAVLAIGVEARGSAVPISYTAQDRSVSASSSATGFPRGGTNPSPVTNQQSESQQASGDGDFSGNVAAQSSVGPQSAGASSSAVQQSTLGDTGFSASGSVTADSVFGTDGPANSSGSSMFQITFNVAQAEAYVFTANLTAITDPGEPGATMASIKLTKAKGGKNIITPITSVSLSNYTVDGTLKPGNYTFTLDTQAASNDQNFDSVNYSISLVDGSAGTSNGGLAPVAGVGSSSAVPLPSSGLTAAVMLSVLGIAGLMRRWIRASML
jgi:hypothetical protein